MIKVLHVVTFLGRGGLEVWLLELLKKIDKNKFHVDVVVQSEKEGLYDSDIEALGFKVLRCKGRGNPLTFSWHFSKLLDQHGPYDVVHSHLHHFSAFPLLVARLKGTKACISHCHSILYSGQKKKSLIKLLYLGVTAYLIDKVSVYGYGCSRGAVADLFGDNWEKKPRREVLHCGVNVPEPSSPAQLTRLREEFDLNRDDKIIGHVGRFTYPKNHNFIIDIAESLVKERKDFVFILAGEGELREGLEARVAANENLSGRIKFLGGRDDVWELLQIMDIFIFPSHYEGLGLALVEAQAAGLPCVVSDTVPTESHVLQEKVFPLPLKDSLEAWVSTLNKLLDQGLKDTTAGVLAVKNSTHNIDNCLNYLESRYSELASNK